MCGWGAQAGKRSAGVKASAERTRPIRQAPRIAAVLRREKTSMGLGLSTRAGNARAARAIRLAAFDERERELRRESVDPSAGQRRAGVRAALSGSKHDRYESGGRDRV